MVVAIDPAILSRAFCKSHIIYLSFLQSASECRQIKLCWFGDIKAEYEEIERNCAKRNPGKQNWNAWRLQSVNRACLTECEIHKVFYDISVGRPSPSILRSGVSPSDWMILEDAKTLIYDFMFAPSGSTDANKERRKWYSSSLNYSI